MLSHGPSWGTGAGWVGGCGEGSPQCCLLPLRPVHCHVPSTGSLKRPIPGVCFPATSVHQDSKGTAGRQPGLHFTATDHGFPLPLVQSLPLGPAFAVRAAYSARQGRWGEESEAVGSKPSCWMMWESGR